MLVLLSLPLLLALSLCGKGFTLSGVEIAAGPAKVLLGLCGEAIALILFCLAFVGHQDLCSASDGYKGLRNCQVQHYICCICTF